MTLRMYAERKKMKLEQVEVRLEETDGVDEVVLLPAEATVDES